VPTSDNDLDGADRSPATRQNKVSGSAECGRARGRRDSRRGATLGKRARAGGGVSPVGCAMVGPMRPSGTAGLGMLLLFGSACGDSVVVARGVSLVSAAVEASDAGLLGDAGADDATPSFESGHGGSSGHHSAPSFPPSPPRPASAPHEAAGGGGGTGGGTSSSGAGVGGTAGTSSSSAKHH